MRRIPGTILVECDLCYKVHPQTYTWTCKQCGLTLCLVCWYRMPLKCLNCGRELGKSY
ncbi:MAG: hypothetical protein ACOWW1_00100 [archaeon]|nr:hypothetical protein [Candidatus Bathyarchaeum sp.]